MALKPCKECGREVSTDARACPHCGKEKPTARGSTMGGWIVLGFIGVNVLGMVSNAVNGGSSTTSPNTGTATGLATATRTSASTKPAPSAAEQKRLLNSFSVSRD